MNGCQSLPLSSFNLREKKEKIDETINSEPFIQIQVWGESVWELFLLGSFFVVFVGLNCSHYILTVRSGTRSGTRSFHHRGEIRYGVIHLTISLFLQAFPECLWSGRNYVRFSRSKATGKGTQTWEWNSRGIYNVLWANSALGVGACVCMCVCAHAHMLTRVSVLEAGVSAFVPAPTPPNKALGVSFTW